MALFVKIKLPLVWGITCFLASLAITFITAQEVNRGNKLLAQNKVQAETIRLADATLERLESYEFGLQSTRGFILGIGDNLSHDKFFQYSQTHNLKKEFPGARGFGFVRRVPVREETFFVKKARIENPLGFTIRQLTPNQQERYIIQYIEPSQNNIASIGLDIGSEKFRRQAADDAILSGEMHITVPITLVQETDHPQQSFLILLPVYSDWKTPPTSERWNKAIGWTYAPLLMQEILDSLKIDSQLYNLKISDVGDEHNPIQFYGFDNNHNEKFTLYPQRITRLVYGRTWQFDVSAHPSLIANISRIKGREIMLFGSLFSLLVAMIAATMGANRQSKLRLAAEESALAAIVESTHDGIIGKTLNGTITSWNKGAEEIFGYSRQEAIGKKIVDLIIPEHLKEEESEILIRIQKEENITQFVTKRLHKDGTLIDVLVNVSPIKNTYGKVISACKTVRDITGIKATERKVRELNTGLELRVKERTKEIEKGREELAQALREQQALQNTVNAQFLYSVTDILGNILEVNDQFCERTGYTRENLISQNHRMMNSGIHPREFWKKMWDKVKQGFAWRDEICNLTAIGELRWFDTVVAPVFDASGKVEKFISLSSDITNRKRAEEHRNQLNLLIENILSAASEVSIIVTDNHGMITMFNQGAERMLGYTANEMVNKQSPAIIHDKDEALERGKELSAEYGYPIEGFRVFVHKPESGQPENRRWTYIKKDGTRIPVSLTATAMRDPVGNLIGFLGIASDISEQVTLENALRKEKENADAASTAKSQFLANMSHEIRTPMNAVLGMLQLVQQTALNKNQLDYISKAKSAATSLLGILNDILDFSKIEAEKLLLDPHPFSIDDLLEDLSIIMAGNQTNKNLELIFDTTNDLPKKVVGDKLRIQQILVNLAGNALKFTENGYVKVSIKRLSQTKEDLAIRVKVEDTGVGISPEHQQKIFAEFTQAEASTTRRYGGTGLGLVICKRLAKLMNSELYLESELGKGSCFWFDLVLPINNAQASIEMIEPEQKLQNISLLVVEDNELNRQVAYELLSNAGAEVDLAEGGIDGVAKVLANQGKYDLVIMDIQMPDIDGFEATRRIRNDIRFQNLPILAMTANASEVDRQECLVAGMDEHTGKPFDLQKLIPMILHLIDRSSNKLHNPVINHPIEMQESLLEDTQSLLNRYGGNTDLFKRFQKKFKPDIEKLLSTLSIAVDNQNIEAAKLALHSIKGLSATLGAIALSQLSSALEKKCRQNEMPTLNEIKELTTLLINSDKEMEQIAMSLGM